MMLTCPSCSAEATKLVIYTEPRKLGCPSCGSPRKVQHNVHLGQTVDKWTAPDGSIRRISVGKAWELANRVISKDDGRSVVNKKTGKLTEY